MAQEIINVGAAANDGLGDPIRTAFIKCNDNFTELYTGSGGANAISNGNTVLQINSANGNISMSVGGFANVAVVTSTGINTGRISATGNIFGANLHASGFVSAAGNVTGSFLFSLGAVSAAGNILGNNLLSAGIVNAGGNVLGVNFLGSGSTTTVSAGNNLALTANVAVTVNGGATFRLPSLTAAEIANITAVNGDMVYNSTVNKFQGYENGSWGNLI